MRTPIVLLGGTSRAPRPLPARRANTEAGRIVAFGHDGFFDSRYIGEFDNLQLCRNIIDWLDQDDSARICVRRHDAGPDTWKWESFRMPLNRGYFRRSSVCCVGGTDLRRTWKVAGFSSIVHSVESD